MATERDDPRLTVSRNAAKLFCEHGVAGTSGDDIAAASGISTRTVWRYFRSKESCAEPLFSVSVLRFASILQQWPLDLSIEAHLHDAFQPDKQTPQDIADDVLAVRLIALLPAEPALRTAWLMSCQLAEEQLAQAIGTRMSRSSQDFDIRLCAATVTAAIRLVDEDISIAAIVHAQKFTLDGVLDRLARAIRAASTLPICDPIK